MLIVDIVTVKKKNKSDTEASHQIFCNAQFASRLVSNFFTCKKCFFHNILQNLKRHGEDLIYKTSFPANIYLFKVNNKITRKR